MSSNEKKVETKVLFPSKIDSATLITNIQRDLIRVHDYAMAQDTSTTFVLADFTMQLKAVVTQEGEKTLFALPTKDKELDPNLMSTVNITLRPIPLEIKPSSSRKPVEAIEGIGTVIGERLRGVGIETVADLAIASKEDLVKVGVTPKKAVEFISMAKLMTKSNVAGVEGVDEQVAELLVASKIDSKEKLAELSPEGLVNVINETINSGKVKVPKSFKLTVDDTTRMVTSAKTILSRIRA
ncbi:MAG: DUF4332 domain-containing protein [Candidatus Bathyarchaeota archaeon]|nr:DUF4332 domain-containing protein [Candidatus Bathyarchaeota archaeon]